MIRQLIDADADAVLEIYRHWASTPAKPRSRPNRRTGRPGRPSTTRFAGSVYEDSGVLPAGRRWPRFPRATVTAASPKSVSMSIPRNRARVSATGLMARGGRGIRKAEGIWTLYSSIFAENGQPGKLHLRHGFREVGYSRAHRSAARSLARHADPRTPLDQGRTLTKAMPAQTRNSRASQCHSINVSRDGPFRDAKSRRPRIRPCGI